MGGVGGGGRASIETEKCCRDGGDDEPEEGTQDIFLTTSRDNKQGQEGDGKERLNGTLHFSIPLFPP